MKLTPLGNAIVKGTAALTILALVGGASWYILTQGDSDDGASPSADNGGGGGGFFGFGGGEEAAVTGGGTSAPSGAIGTKSNPLKVSFVSFHGYAPALIANGDSLTTQAGSIFEQEGVYVEFLIQDNIPTLAENFGSGTAHCSWRTIDYWAQEHTGLKGSGYDGRMVMVVDNTRGGDAVIARGDINSIEDLAGHKISLLQYTPSDWLLRYAIDQSSLSGKKKSSIDYVYVNAEEGTAGVRATFTSKQVDAAVLWEPDLSLALKADPGAHIIYSTQLATNLIYDGMVCDTRVIDANRDTIQKFVNGWMRGTDEANADKSKATKALLATEPFFQDLAKQEGEGFINGLYNGIVWTSLADNIRVLGLGGEGDTNHFARIYSTADGVWRDSGAIANPNAPVINPDAAFDYTFIKTLMDKNASAKAEAAKPEFTFTAAEAEKAVAQEAKVTKPVTINFDSGSAELSKRAQKTIDDEVVPLIESMGSAYFSIEGNTDSTGSKSANTRLSEARAKAVESYLVKEWEFPAERFKVIGNGPAKPACNEKSPDEGLTLEQCLAANRRTDIAVYSR
jgi:NitT/TauT family transport system substrate-binding protein